MLRLLLYLSLLYMPLLEAMIVSGLWIVITVCIAVRLRSEAVREAVMWGCWMA